MDSQQQLFTSSANEVIPIICGTFTSIYLYILQFSTLSRDLTIQSRIPAQGPHQYLALTPGRAGLYATSWAWPPSLYGFSVGAAVGGGARGGVEVVYQGKTPITRISVLRRRLRVRSTSPEAAVWRLSVMLGGGLESVHLAEREQCYLPFPPYPIHAYRPSSRVAPPAAISSYITITNTHIYSIGGPTGEVHVKPNATSVTGFGEKVQDVLFVPAEELEGWDKTNKALTQPDGSLELVKEVKSIREGDGPRHAVVSSNGRSQFVDVYDITEQGLSYVHSSSLIPKGDDPHTYRGDTIRISKSTPYVFATTRGADPSIQGWLCAYAIDPATGHLLNPGEGEAPSAVYRTPTSGGKANAIEVIAVNGRGRQVVAPSSSDASEAREEMDWLVLTDSEQGLVLVISWDGYDFREISRVKMEEGDGASHAVWLE
ncbi:hypothetical protein QFC21_002895 [Naganishia friedmannii]|uniref:Uncharacterized protein n=1 Tax=Naganishia friedmannii TaxID=89922 RepID=A0ACC2VUF9_9TREE|nr:hypothetical protein QFC21_002895 [Naganishia friedmannii]